MNEEELKMARRRFMAKRPQLMVILNAAFASLDTDMTGTECLSMVYDQAYAEGFLAAQIVKLNDKAPTQNGLNKGFNDSMNQIFGLKPDES